MATQDQIDSFHQFATEQLAGGEANKSIDELYDLWRTLHCTPEDVAAVRAAIDDMQKGDRGIPLDEHVSQIRSKHNL